ncbi:MAG: DUF3489 domain-containing protein [Pseudomonadota bacterium]
MPKPTKKSLSKKRTSKSSNKQDEVLKMLHRKAGVSIADIAQKTGWQPHTVRGFLSGVVRKKLALPLATDIGKDGKRRYRLPTRGASA